MLLLQIEGRFEAEPAAHFSARARHVGQILSLMSHCVCYGFSRSGLLLAESLNPQLLSSGFVVALVRAGLCSAARD